MEYEHECAMRIKTKYPETNVILQDTIPYVSYKVADIECLLKSRIRSSIRVYDSTEKYCKLTHTVGGDQMMSYVTHKGLEKLLFLSRSDEAIKLVELMGFQSIRKWFPSIENDTMLNIIEAFKCENIKRQYVCDKYRIDLYFIDYNIAVECDELQHNIKINKQHDLLREDIIKRKLKCEFIRFKPYEKDFNIFELIGKIHSKIIECIKFDTNEKQDKIETKKYLIKSAASAIKSKNMMRDKTDGKYHINGCIYEKIRGTREEVWCGTAYQTTGELKKMDLEMNKYGRVVSKVKMITATMDNNFVKYGVLKPSQMKSNISNIGKE
jgi:very-short-patch-repair endonuclease